MSQRNSISQESDCSHGHGTAGGTHPHGCLTLLTILRSHLGYLHPDHEHPSPRFCFTPQQATLVCPAGPRTDQGRHLLVILDSHPRAHTLSASCCGTFPGVRRNADSCCRCYPWNKLLPSVGTDRIPPDKVCTASCLGERALPDEGGREDQLHDLLISFLILAYLLLGSCLQVRDLGF